MKRGLVLSGGGAKGAYEVGVLKHLMEKGITFDVIAGTSIGAFNASLLLSFGMDVLGIKRIVEEVWKKLGKNSMYSISPWFSHIASNSPMRKTLERYLDVEKIINSPILLYVCATNLQTKEEVAFSNHDSRLKQNPKLWIDMVLASMNIPIVFSPMMIDPYQYVDGGTGNNTPLNNVIKEGCEEIYTILLSPEKETPSTKKYGNILETAWRVQDIVSYNAFKEDIQRTKEISRTIEWYSKAEKEALEKIDDPILKQTVASIFERNRPFPGKKKLKIFYVQPTTKLPIETKDFNPVMSAEVIELGYLDSIIQLGRVLI